MPSLDEPLILPTAGRYAFPADASAPLPRVYGDFLDPLVMPADAEDGGLLPAVMIDITNWIFCLNTGPVPASPPPHIYVGDQRQDATTIKGDPVYLFSPAADFEGQGIIAGVQFLVNPGTSNISWRGLGTTLGVGGPLITNPIQGFFDAFAAMGGWTLDDFDLPICYETLRTLETLGVDFHWVFWQQHRTYREWLTEILRCYHVDLAQTMAGKLALQLDKPILGLPTTVLHTLDARTDLAGTEDDVEWSCDEVNIVNTLTVKRRLKWTTNEYTDSPTVDYQPSVNLYGALRDDVELPACYQDTHGLRWVQAFFQRYSFLPALVRFTVRGLGYLPCLPGTYLGFICPWLGWTEPRLLKVLNQEIDATDESPVIHFECFDCQRAVDAPVVLPISTITTLRRRVRVPDPIVDLQPPAAAADLVIERSYRRVVLRWTAPADQDYSHTEIWAAPGISPRASTTLVRTGGMGVPPGGPCEETFEVLEGSVYSVWLMTVDHAGNGARGTGNWHPASALIGVTAAPALIETGALAPAAVTELYTPTTSLTGVGLLEQVAVTTFLPATFPTGSFVAWGQITVTIPSLSTLQLLIREETTPGATTTGRILGQVTFSNIFLGPITSSFVVPAAHFLPLFGVHYYLTVRCFAQDGSDVAYTVPTPGSLLLQQTKR